MTNLDGRRMITKRIHEKIHGKVGSITSTQSTLVDEQHLDYTPHHIIANDQKDWEELNLYLRSREGKDPAYDVR